MPEPVLLQSGCAHCQVAPPAFAACAAGTKRVGIGFNNRHHLTPGQLQHFCRVLADCIQVYFNQVEKLFVLLGLIPNTLS